MFKNIQKNKGAALTILLLFFIVVSLTILIGLVSPVVREFKISSDSLVSKQSYFNAESGMEDLMYRIKSGKEIGEVGEDRTLLISNSYVPIPVTITDGLNNRKNITMTSEYKSRERSLNVSLTTSAGVSFNYAVFGLDFQLAIINLLIIILYHKKSNLTPPNYQHYKFLMVH